MTHREPGLLERIAALVMRREAAAKLPPRPVGTRYTLAQLARAPQLWVAMLWHAMRATGNGYHRPSMKRRPPKGASHWRGERRADKVAAAERNAAFPVFTGKINFRRSDPQHPLFGKP